MSDKEGLAEAGEKKTAGTIPDQTCFPGRRKSWQNLAFRSSWPPASLLTGLGILQVASSPPPAWLSLTLPADPCLRSQDSALGVHLGARQGKGRG